MKKLPVIALSQRSSTEPVDGRVPASRQRRPEANDVYWAGSAGRSGNG